MKVLLLLSLFIIQLLATPEIIPEELPQIISEAMQPENIATQSEDFTLWSALFGLGVVALIALFLSSEQLNNFKKSIQKKEKVEKKIDQLQSQILSDMGENIQDMVKKTSDTAKEIARGGDRQHIQEVIKSENQILSLTTNLIEFLRIKSKKIKIVNEEFILSNLLNDVSGLLKNSVLHSRCNIVYDIHSNIAERLYGDTLNLSKIITNLILYFIEHNASKVVLELSRDSIFSKDENLYFTLKSDYKYRVEDETSIFTANYNEKTQKYESLGIFIAKELSNLMNGELIARNDKNGNVEFFFNIPYKSIKTKEKNSIKEKKILIVDELHEAAVATKEILTALNHKAKICKKEEFILNPPEFNEYDLIIISQHLLSETNLKTLEQKKAKIVVSKTLFEKDTKEFLRKKEFPIMIKPATRSDMKQLLEKIYLSKEAQEQAEQQKSPTQIQESKEQKAPPVYKGNFNDKISITLESFVAFRSSRVLLVEDNIINQKVFTGILGKSAIDIKVANHGQEALDMLNREEKNFDIIFMDINMPVMDGYNCALEIRKIPIYDSVPIIALSALTSPSEVEKMFDSKMNAYLAKPLKKETLYSAFEMFLTKEKDRRAKPRKTKEFQPQEIKIEGLNVAKGLKQTGGDPIFYKEVLVEFRDAYKLSDKTFQILVEDFRYEQLRLLCVDVRGLAGSIGADALHDLTTDILQRLLYKKHELIPTFVKSYKEELHKVLEGIDTYLENY